MTNTTPPDWVLIEAKKRCGWQGLYTPDQLQRFYTTHEIYRPLCDMILKHEQPPVDRKLLCALEADVERLREALKGVMPYVLSEYLQCNGDKCRHLTCASCFGEDTAGKHSDKATEAKRTALATLEARKARAALGETK